MFEIIDKPVHIGIDMASGPDRTEYFIVQPDLFVPRFYALIDRLADEAIAEIHAMTARAREEIDRRLAFLNRSRAQKRRFERYRQLLGELSK